MMSFAFRLVVSGNRVVKCKASETEAGPSEDNDKVMHLFTFLA